MTVATEFGPFYEPDQMIPCRRCTSAVNTRQFAGRVLTKSTNGRIKKFVVDVNARRQARRKSMIDGGSSFLRDRIGSEMRLNRLFSHDVFEV